MKKPDETDRIFNKLPVSASKFIQLVIRKMRYRREVRQEVEAELTAHFEDELKDCKTDSEREQKARRLITDFGDVKLLAVLLRRAKKRCRPLWKTAVARTFQTAGIITLFFIIYVIWFMTGKPVITTDYVAELNRINLPVTDETLNAAPLYHKAAERYSKLPEDISVLVQKRYWEFTKEQKQLMEKWLTDNQETLDLVVSGSQKPYYWEKYSTGRDSREMISVLIPHLREFRDLARALSCRARLRAEQGRYEEALADIKSCYRFGRHLKGDRLLVEQLVGIAIEAISVHTIRDVLTENKIDSATLTKLQSDFEQILAKEDFAVSLIAEEMAALDVIQRTFTGGVGTDHIIPARLKKLLPDIQVISAGPTRGGSVSIDEYQQPGFLSGLMLLIRFTSGSIYSFAKNNCYILFLHPDKQKTLRSAKQVYDYWQTLQVKTPARIRDEAMNPEKEAMEIVKGNLLLEFFVPVLVRVNELIHRHKVDVEATLTIIAILRYYQQTGDFPDDLQQLIEAGFLKACPVDPYSDKRLVYRKVEKNFILYGVGRNFMDDGGQVAVIDGVPRQWGTKDEGDWVFWPVSESQSR